MLVITEMTRDEIDAAIMQGIAEMDAGLGIDGETAYRELKKLSESIGKNTNEKLQHFSNRHGRHRDHLQLYRE